MNYSWEIVKIILYLGLVLGLIYLIAYLFKNRMMPRGRGRGYIQIMEQTYITPKVSLSLVRVKNEIFLLSISDKGVEVVKSWPGEEFGDIVVNEDSKSFKEYIQEIINRGKSYGFRRDDNEQQ